MTAAKASPLDVRRFIDERPVSAYQWLILALCSIVAFVDGFDTSAMAFVAPALAQTWDLPRTALGPVMSAALVGMAAGGLIAGPIGDRLGRKGVMIVSVILFGIASIASAFAGSLPALTLLRVVAGLGFGAALPNAAALLAEYTPDRRRSLFVSFMFCVMTLGNACSGFIAAAIIPRFGWQSMFLLGGVVPLALGLAMIQLLPESVRFMVVLDRPRAGIAAVLARIAPEARALLEAAPRFVLPTATTADARNPIRTVVSPPLLLGTMLMWLVFFSGLVVVYLMTSWLPILLKDGGFSIRAAANLTALFQLGGTVGAMLVAWLMGGIGPHRAIALFYGLAGVSILVLSQSLGNLGLLAVAVLATGFFTSGAQTPMTALATAFYPTPVRSTGIGWMLGIGRLGAVVGSFLGAPLLAMGFGFTTIVAGLAVPLAIAAAAVAVKGVAYAAESAAAPRPVPSGAIADG